MGWLCPCCGSENPFTVRRCRACGHGANAGFLGREFVCAGAERLLQDGRVAADTLTASDLSGQMAKWNRFAQRCFYVTVSLFVALGIWIGVQTTQNSGPDVVSQRLSSAAESAGGRAAGQVLTSMQEVYTGGDAAVQQWRTAFDDVENRINSVDLLLLRLETENAPGQAGQAFLSLRGSRTGGESVMQRLHSAFGSMDTRIGDGSLYPLYLELEAVQERMEFHTLEAANTAGRSYGQATEQIDKLSREITKIPRPEDILEKVSKAFEAFKQLVGLDPIQKE